ncbi:MAG: class II aldolase/adducin family protein [Betaproteobacteria bacterium]
MNTTTQNPESAAALDLAVRELVMANRILAREGILDGFGHVSVRHPANAGHYLISRQLAPALVQREDVVVLDLDSNPVGESRVSLFLERFIHGEIYRRRPDVHAVVHSHSPTTIPFGITKVKLRPLYHMSGFLGAGAAHFEIADTDPASDMLVRSPQLGAALADALGDAPLALMRGHGNVVVAGDIKAAVYRAIYCELNAKLQLQALQLDPEPRYLSTSEGANADTTNMKVVARPWRYWADRAGCLDLLDP